MTQQISEKKDSTAELESDLLHNNQLFDTTANSLDNLLTDILNRDLNSKGLMDVYKHLEPWITSINDNERERSVRSLSNLLNHYAKNFMLHSNVSNKSCFSKCE